MKLRPGPPPTPTPPPTYLPKKGDVVEGHRPGADNCYWLVCEDWQTTFPTNTRPLLAANLNYNFICPLSSLEDVKLAPAGLIWSTQP